MLGVKMHPKKVGPFSICYIPKYGAYSLRLKGATENVLVPIKESSKLRDSIIALMSANGVSKHLERTFVKALQEAGPLT